MLAIEGTKNPLLKAIHLISILHGIGSVSSNQLQVINHKYQGQKELLSEALKP